MAVKLDLKKAYDVLDWAYIKTCLLQFGFSVGWCDRVMNCITSTSFSVLVNGSPSGYFTPSRGIRQGDPLSPYIFILCMEPFIRHCNSLALVSKTNVGILSSPRGVRISNLVFADDCLIFDKATPVAARNINKLLLSFSEVSGQNLNLHKSTVYFSNNVAASSRANVSNILPIQHKATIGRYLGISNIVFWKDPLNAKTMIERIKGKFAGWKAQTLSRAGRLTLIKASVSGIPNHTLSCFKCPPEVSKEMNSTCRKFFWGNQTKIPHVSWKDICVPKEMGGLGVRLASQFNKAALAKLGWICLTNDSNWWAQIVRLKYLQKENFLALKKKSSHSSAWQAILDARSVLNLGIRWIVGNGKSIPFWTAHWVFPFPLLDLIPSTQRSSLNLQLVVADFLTDQCWNIVKLKDVVDDDILDKIISIPLPLAPLEDQLIWGPDPKGIFSIKSAYNVQVQDATSHPQAALLKKMWGLTIPPKVKIFSWLLIRKRLQLRSHLHIFLPHINPDCPLCNSHSETINHLFATCSFTQSIWSCTNMDPASSASNFDFLTWLGTLPAGYAPDGPNALSRALLICWQIWEAINNLVFKDVTPHPVRVLDMAGQVGLEFWNQNVKHVMGPSAPLHIKWKPPPWGWVKLNFDGSIRNNVAASGFVIRDSDGHVLLAGAKNIGDNTISVAECLALRDGLAYAIHRGWRNILVEGDSKLIIDCVKQEADPPWCICILIHDIKLLSSFCGHLSFNHIYREANFTADAVANLGHGLHPSKLWESGLLLNCSVPFFFDLFGPACPRDFCL
ncbi:hypothetical protein L3X38_018237 [Prunus dulcis]|uniref:Reverse transcriptase domain-containing protein n=1 Tax=Prunus dulcis TaxID=3755 RepID=A0AAD4ZAJ9_PRUDU|nr:hypothetical protein L3X38_018237 [Prunus dulcis]